MGNHRLQVFPVWEMSFAKMPENNWHIATERVKWSVKYQKKHGIDTAQAELPDEHGGEGAAPGQARLPRARPVRLRAASTSAWTPDGKLYVIEANPNPQLAQGEDFAQSAQRAERVVRASCSSASWPRAAVAAEPDRIGSNE